MIHATQSNYETIFLKQKALDPNLFLCNSGESALSCLHYVTSKQVRWCVYKDVSRLIFMLGL